jgi:hypothetical protein
MQEYSFCFVRAFGDRWAGESHGSALFWIFDRGCKGRGAVLLLDCGFYAGGGSVWYVLYLGNQGQRGLIFSLLWSFVSAGDALQRHSIHY